MHPGVAFPLERYVPPEGAAICDVELLGGTNVSVNPAVIHMNKNVFGEDAGQFRPERWIEASSEQLKLMDRSFLSVSSHVNCHVTLHTDTYLSLATELELALEGVSRSWRWANSSPRYSDTWT